MNHNNCSNCAEYAKKVGRLEAELLEAKRQLEKEKEESLDFCGKGLILEKQFEKLKAELAQSQREKEWLVDTLIQRRSYRGLVSYPYNKKDNWAGADDYYPLKEKQEAIASWLKAAAEATKEKK